MKFSTLIIDPPWKTSDQLKMSPVKRGASSNYSVMSTEDLCNLPIKDIADPNGCVLGLWVLGSMLEDGLKVMKAWGFEQKQVYVWVKTKKQTSINSLASNIIDNFTKKNPISFIAEVAKSSFVIGDWLLSFGMGRLFRQTHEICLIGMNNTKLYSKLENKSQRSVCFEENKGHSIKPNCLHESLELMFPTAARLEVFGRRPRAGWTVIGNDVDDMDIRTSLQILING